MTKKSAISADFLEEMDAGLSPIDHLTGTVQVKHHHDVHTKQIKERAHPQKTDTKPDKLAKDRLTVQISSEVVERAKDAVYWTPGLTIAQLVEESLAGAIDKIEKKNGKPFQKRKAELKAGRPVK